MGNVKALVLLSKILFQRRSPRDDVANLVIFLAKPRFLETVHTVLCKIIM